MKEKNVIFVQPIETAVGHTDISIGLNILTTEYDLINACIDGNLQAQKLLYDQYKRPLMGICRRYCASREQAQDVLQESFIKIFTKLSTYKASGNLQAWMTRIVINTAIKMNMKWENRKVDEEVTDYDRPSEEMDGFEKLSHEELLALIAKLPAGYRNIFNLYVIDGFTHDEIGDMMNISPGTSKSQLSRAKALLAHWLRLIQSEENEILKK